MPFSTTRQAQRNKMKNAGLKNNIKYILRSFFNYDPSLRKITIPEDYKDQEKILGKSVNVIFDVGANVGQTSFKYRKLFPHAIIHSFEPFPPVFEKYLLAISGDKHIKPNQLALSKNAGTSTFFTNKNNYTNSLLPVEASHKNDENFAPDTEIKVTTSTLDLYCKANHIEHIDILKMDVQGGELMVLQGAENMLKEGKVDLIYTEITTSPFYENQPTFETIRSFLEKYGFKVFRSYDDGVPTKNLTAEGDVIFIRKDLRK